MNILQIVGYKNAGKTTLVCELVRHYAGQGLRVGTIKHDGAHDFEPDVPDTDSRRYREAGAAAAAVTSARRTALYAERPTPLPRLVEAMEEQGLDLLLVEGFKDAPDYPKLVLLRGDEDAALLTLPRVAAAVLRDVPSEALRLSAAERGIPLFHPADHDFRPLLALADRILRLS